MGVPVASSSPDPKTFQDFRKKARGPYLYPDELTNQHRASYMQKTTTKQKTKEDKKQTNKKKQQKTTKKPKRTKKKTKQSKTKKKHEKG